jgi:cell division protein FtsA
MSRNRIIGAVEIGTAKINVLVAEITQENAINLIGYSRKPSAGIKKGVITDFKDATTVTHSAIAEAEKMAGYNIDGIHLSLTGKHLKGTFNKGSSHVSSHDGRVVEQDIQRAIEDAQSKCLPDNRIYIHHIRNPFFLDGRPMQSPIGMEGENLEVGFWSVHADEVPISNYIHLINGFHLEVDDMIVASICSGEATLHQSMKENGVVVIDIGRGTTDFALYRNGYIVHTGVVCIGGDHFTNDLSQGLRINAREAERLKIEEGTLLRDEIDPKDRVWLRGDLSIGDRSFPPMSIYKILHSRGEELLRVVHSELSNFLNPEDTMGFHLILTGGGSQLRGLVDLAHDIFKLPVEIGFPPSWVDESLRTPENSTAIGLLHYAANHKVKGNKPSIGTERKGGILGKLKDFFLHA